jgi:hypothetical protein
MPPPALPPPIIPRVEQHATISPPPKKAKSHWLLWWKIEPEELAKQVDEYKILKITTVGAWDKPSILAVLSTGDGTDGLFQSCRNGRVGIR